MIKKLLKSITPVYKLYAFFKLIVFLLKIKKAEIADMLGEKPMDGMPIPPPKLRYRVHGALELDGFLAVGENCARDIKAILKQEDLELHSFQKVLDFGCGCARVLRFFKDQSTKCSLFGTDIDPELITWCKTMPQIAEFAVNGHFPPLQYPDNFFDFIYSISVFTHLDEEMQWQWLQELHRITKPEGYVLLSIHGQTSFAHLPKNSLDTLLSKGFVFIIGQTGFLKLDGLPDFYQSAYHTKSYIQEKWGKYFTGIHYYEKGINSHQDAIIMKKVLDNSISKSISQKGKV